MNVTAGGGVAAKWRAIGSELGGEYLEREDVIDALTVAVLAGQNSLIVGPPGTGKSALVRALTARVTGATYWETLMSKYTSPTQIFGPIDIAALHQGGQMSQVYADHATEAHIGFIDEVFNTNATALNPMLSFLNEHLYHPEAGGQPVKCNLIAAVGASNYLRTDGDCAAIYDRFTVRLEVDYLADQSNFAALLKSAAPGGSKAAPTTVTLDELTHAVEVEVPAVEIPDGVIDAVCDLRADLWREGLRSSDRRWKTAIRLIQASAYLAGRTVADTSDMRVLQHVMWEDPEHRAKVARTVLDKAITGAGEALDLADAAAELEAELKSKAGESRQKRNEWASEVANVQLNTAAERLAELIEAARNEGKPTTHLESALTKVNGVRVQVAVECMNVTPALAKAALGIA